MVVAIAMVRDEKDIIASTVSRMIGQVDRVLVADNGSTDGTREILEKLPCEVIDDREVGYYQSRKMSALAEQARLQGAEWIVPFDADEVHLPASGTIAELLEDLPDAVLLSEATLFDHVATGIDPDERDPVARLRWRRGAAASLRKVACRAVEGLIIDQGNHSARFPGVAHPPAVTNAIQVRHFPYRSVAQLVSKVRNGAAAYAASDLPEEVGSHWRQYGRILNERGEEGIAELFKTWFYREDPTVAVTIEGEAQGPLLDDPCP